MPQVLREGKYRFFFFSMEGDEPPHIHVESAEKYAKFWLEPVQLAESHKFLSSELSAIRKIVEKNKQKILDTWYEHFDT